MGQVALPPSGYVYVDTNSFIYTVERVEPFRTILDGFWQAVLSSKTVVLTSELTLMEVLVKPLRQNDRVLETLFRSALLRSPDVRLTPVSQSVLERAASLRASTNLKTPDAIHAATALEHGCVLFLTNDVAFQRVAGLPVTVLSNLLIP